MVTCDVNEYHSDVLCHQSLLLFFVTMDCTVKKITLGIVRDLTLRLKDFSDDTVLLAHTKQNMQVKSENLSRVPKNSWRKNQC